MNLTTTVKSIQDIMRKDDGVDGDAQRLGQLTWMLFLKVFDQREEEWEDDNPKYRSPLPKRMRWRHWAAYVAGADGKKRPQVSPSEVIGFVNNELFPALKELDANKGLQHKVIRSVFEDANNFMKSGTQLLAVIEKLEESINFHDFKTRASLGDVYEQLLNDLRSAGNAGEFYTPRAITRFMADRVNPRLDKRESVIDPACGTGGFLTAVIDHFRNQLTKKSSAEDKRAIEELISGIEKKQLPHLLCTTNMLLHASTCPGRSSIAIRLRLVGMTGAPTTRSIASLRIHPSVAMRTGASAATIRLTCEPAKRQICSWPSSSRSCLRKMGALLSCCPMGSCLVKVSRLL